MIDSNEIKQRLTPEDVIQICAELGSDCSNQSTYKDALIFNTYICHGGDSYKLYYYIDSKTFHCFTCSSSYDIFELVRRAKGFGTFVQAYYWLLNFLHLSSNYGFASKQIELTDDWAILHKVQSYQKPKESTELKPINQNMINYFYGPVLPTEWEKENIDYDTCVKYDIRIDPSIPKIIIPHKDINGQVVGIRGRTYNPEELEAGCKYMPVILDHHTIYNHPLGSNLYGLYENAEVIKRLKKVVIFESDQPLKPIFHFRILQPFLIS